MIILLFSLLSHVLALIVLIRNRRRVIPDDRFFSESVNNNN